MWFLLCYHSERKARRFLNGTNRWDASLLGMIKTYKIN